MTKQEQTIADDKMRAEIAKLMAETTKINSEIPAFTAKLAAETAKITSERQWYPAVVASGATLAIVAIVKIFL